ncbi:MAG: SagB/ThcOx family dehydrogenase [Candidatus Zixiibacteriota bacterium]|nr:MAG: SagB/ThcOx family dehydrogenase [candidate division Zixibacteria bacterium]
MGDELKNYSLESAIRNRRTIREITGKNIPAEYLELLVWSAFGMTLKDRGDKYRTAPSAGATYPIEIQVFVERVDGYQDGIYIYDTGSESLKMYKPGIFLPEVQKMSWDQEFVSLSNAVFITVYNPRKIERDYGNKSRDYALLECGHIAQNILLTATALNLGSVPVGAFSQRRLTGLLELNQGRTPLYMICVGTID